MPDAIHLKLDRLGDVMANQLEARVTDPPAGLRPGLQGVAKVDAGETSLANAWLRGSIVRLQLLLWRWVP